MTERTLDTFHSETTLAVVLTGWPTAPAIRTADGRVLERAEATLSMTPAGPMMVSPPGRDAATPGAWQFTLEDPEMPAELHLVIETPGEADRPLVARRRAPEPDPKLNKLIEDLRDSLSRPVAPTPPTSGRLQ